MSRWGRLRGLLGLLLLFPLLGARQHPGPVTLRGVARHVHVGGFQLQTRSHGLLTVLIFRATVIDSKTQRRAVLHEADDVGVRGELQGQVLRAMHIRIYAVTGKAATIRGRVEAMTGQTVTVVAGKTALTVRVTGATVIVVNKGHGRLNDVQVGDRVSVRYRSGNALHIHVYRSKEAAVTLNGTLLRVDGHELVLHSGAGAQHVAFGAGMVVRVGSRRETVTALHPGQQVTVRACCRGGPLVASSVRVHVVPMVTVTVKGTVEAVMPGSLRVATPRGVMVVITNNATVYRIGTVPSRGGVEVGDRVGLRVTRREGQTVALKVHVYLSSRRIHKMTGRVVSVTGTAIMVQHHGTHVWIVLLPGGHVTLNGKAAALRDLHAGDRVHATGRLAGNNLKTSNVAATRKPAIQRHLTLHGTVLSVQRGTMVVQDTAGARHTVRLPAASDISLHGAIFPGQLFPGLTVTVRGIQSGAVLVATHVTVTARLRKVTGRLVSLKGQHLVVQGSSTSAVQVDVPSGFQVTDGNHRIGAVALHLGAWLAVEGWVESSGALRANAIAVLHPSVDTSAVVLGGAGLMVQTTRGVRYQLVISSTTTISAERGDVPLQAAQIPPGTRVHVVGQVDSQGRLVVTEMTVRLHSVSLRGQVAASAAGGLSVSTPGGKLTVVLLPTAEVEEGTHVMTVQDIVVGDDVTVYGYQLSGSIVARKVSIHRWRIGLDGTVQGLLPSGFTLQAADGSHQVLVSDTTAMNGVTAGTLAAGMTVHVSGYLRGDGSILASEVKLLH